MSGEDEVLNVIESVSKSVVHINTVRVVKDYYYRTMPLKGSGSGFILEPDGYIVTNAHVVRQANRIGVVLWDNKPVEGVILGICRSIDVAVVKIDSEGLPAARLGDSDKLRVGQSVYAIGNPFGLVGGPTVTSGVVSALDRSIQGGDASFSGLVQTDAAINPGNSGGPLVDTSGRVIAINTVMECVEQIKTHGQVTKPWVGIYGVTVTPQVASYYNLSRDSGVLVTNVVPRSPAQKAQVTSGDVIVALDGAQIRGTSDLKSEIEGKSIGANAEVTLVRGRQMGTVRLRIEGSP